MSGAGLQIENVTVTFDKGRVTGLHDVSLSLPSGAITVLLGHSGSGKSTLLRVLAGLERADAGRVTLDGRVLSDPAIRVAPEQRGIGMVFQALELWPHMTVAEHIAFGLEGRPSGRRALESASVSELAADVGLPEGLLKRRPDTLSGGERQRVAIARTLAAGPSVICYDEPLASLDPGHRASLRRLIRRLAAEHGTTVVYVTHDADEALEMGDRIVVLESGRVIEEGTPESLLRTPATLAAAQALGRSTTVPVEVQGTSLHTVLGDLEAADPAATDRISGAGRAHAVIRPAQLAPADGGVAAIVESVRPDDGGWRFTARVDDVWVEGCSPTALEPGSTVTVRVTEPVVLVGEDEA